MLNSKMNASKTLGSDLGGDLKVKERAKTAFAKVRATSSHHESSNYFEDDEDEEEL